MQHKSRPKETLQQKVDRLNGYRLNGYTTLFDRLYLPLCQQVEQAGKQLAYHDGRYVIEDKPAIDVTSVWLDALLSQG